MEFDRFLDETFLKFKEDELERNRQHKLQMAAIFTIFLSSAKFSRFNTTNSFRATIPAPMFSPMGSYIRLQHHNVISKSNENTVEESSYWEGQY